MYIIKKIPEDFKVKEIISIPRSSIGTYGYFLLQKKNRTTIDAVVILSNKLRIPLGNIGFAGNKDKHALTEQLISIKHSNLEHASCFSDDTIRLEYVGSGAEPVCLGDLSGNEFEITVRNLVDEEINRIDERIKYIQYIPNYYDEQRFSKNNVEIGLCLLKRKFDKACKLVNHPSLTQFLAVHPNNCIGALRLLPQKTLLLYIHSVQSYVFNETLNALIKNGRKVPYSMGQFIFPDKKRPNQKLPVAGFGVEYPNNKIEDIIETILKKLVITNRSFIFREVPHLSSEGSSRDSIMNVSAFLVEKIGKDSFHDGKLCARIKFSLGKASYATILVKYLFD